MAIKGFAEILLGNLASRVEECLWVWYDLYADANEHKLFWVWIVRLRDI